MKNFYLMNISAIYCQFIKRNSLEFRDPSTITSLYVSLVRPHLEYCCIIWNPSLKVDIVMLERVQENFNRYLFFKLNWRIEKKKIN